MFYCTALLLLAATADVFGYTLVGNSPQVGIVGGDPVPITAVPYMADLREEDGHHWCSATIITKQFLLTAAQCIVPNVTYIVAVGTEDARGGVIYEVEKLLPHEKALSHHGYDIGLVKLTEEIIVGPNVDFVELASDPYVLEPGLLLNVTGWGSVEKDSEESIVLRQASVPFISQSKCEETYSGYLTDNLMCAGDDKYGKGPCDGDRGSPLVYENIQVGIVTYNKGCGDLPALYTRVPAFEQWIRDTIARNS